MLRGPDHMAIRRFDGFIDDVSPFLTSARATDLRLNEASPLWRDLRPPVVAGSPDPATFRDRRSPLLHRPGDLRSEPVGRSGDRPTTRVRRPAHNTHLHVPKERSNRGYSWTQPRQRQWTAIAASDTLAE